MTLGAISTWVVQATVTWLVFRDLGPDGGKFVARALGIQPGYGVWICLIGLAMVSLLLNSRIAANTFSAHTGKRPSQDWHSYGQSGAAGACYWCGLTSFGFSLLVAALVLPTIGVPAVKAGAVCALALLVNAVLTRFAVHFLLARRYGQAVKRQQQPAGSAIRWPSEIA